jgi:hypothetical protein
MTNLRTLAAALAFFGAAAATASAAPLTVSGNGDTFAVQYDSAYTGNIVGGGFVATEGNNNTLRIIRQDDGFARSAAGIPVFTGGSDGSVAYLPTGNGSASIAAR